jgi:glycosyltransferase involved in cell wall biosynthesis
MLFLLKNFQSSKQILVFIHTLADQSLDKTVYIARGLRPLYQLGNWVFGLLLKVATSYLRCSVLVHSERVAAYVSSQYKIDSNKILVHPLPCVTFTADDDAGVDRECAENALCLKNSILQSVGTQDAILVGIFGFISRYKGHELAVEAIKRLPSNYCLVVLGITHPENETNPTMDYLSKFKILYPDRITLHCHASDSEAAAFLRVCDVLVAPYLPVNLSASGAFTYCLASGVPVIASNIPAFMDIFVDTEAFVKINHGSVDQLAAAILEVSGNKFLRNRVVRNAVNYVDKYSFRNFSLFLARSLNINRE